MDAENQLRFDFTRAKLRRYADEVIKGLKELGRKDGMQSPADSGLNNIWEEWLVQVHGEQSIFYEQYEEVVQGMVNAFVEKLPRDEVGLIWLGSEAGADYLDELSEDDVDDEPGLSDMKEGAVAELFSMVMEIANNSELPENVEKYLYGSEETEKT